MLVREVGASLDRGSDPTRQIFKPTTKIKAAMKHAVPPPTEAGKMRLGWSRPLARPVALRDGPDLVTLADVRTFLFKRLRADRQEGSSWQRVTALLLSAAKNDEVHVAAVPIPL